MVKKTYFLGTLLCSTLCLFAAPTLSAQSQLSGGVTILGRVLDMDKKISEPTVNVYVDNDLKKTFSASKSGRFTVDLVVGAEYTIEVLKEGFMQKRFVFDAKSDVPHDQVEFAAFPMDVHLISADRFEGIDNDALDFPFALIKYSKKAKDFDHDPAYTQNMMRANAALMLMSARAKE